LLPCNGYGYESGDNFLHGEQENLRLVWGVATESDNKTISPYSGVTIPAYNEYNVSLNNKYSFSSNQKKMFDLIATFKPEILESFEQLFLDFASERLNEEIPYKPYDVKYTNFQDILKEIVTVKKIVNDKTDIVDLILSIKKRQVDNLSSITSSMLSLDNLMKFTLSNPKEIDNYALGGFVGYNVSNFKVNDFDVSQITAQNSKLIKLLLGEDMDGYYLDFFSEFNIELNETNIRAFRSIIYIYSGKGYTGNFKEYLKTNIITPKENRLNLFLTMLTKQISAMVIDKGNQTITQRRGYNDDPIKLELYNFFKSFNDKWIAGNSIGQRTLMEEFLFLDKANKDIGDSVFIDMERLRSFIDPKNKKINLYSLINLLIQDTGFDMRALPSYVNFYGTNFNNKTKITPSKTVAKDIFGTFLDVDYQESSPKIILQYIGLTSKHLEMSDINKSYGFKNDSFNIGNVNNNSVIVAPDVFRNVDFTKSNKVVAFEVSFGDQNQSMFKTVGLDQSSIKNTTESFNVLERLGNTEGGGSVAQMDIGLFEIYRQASYTCEVTMMGNVMIQPTMYFYLKNIPLFRGSYWITEVRHKFKANDIETVFKGSRIPTQSLPEGEHSLLASYRSLFDKLIKKSAIRVKSLQNPENHGLIELETPIKGEIKKFEIGKKEYGISYNGNDGENYIRLVDSSNGEWLKTPVVTMGGTNNPLNDDVIMGIATRLTLISVDKTGQLTWKDIKNQTNSDFYSSMFSESPDNIYEFKTTEFYNPIKKGTIVKVSTLVDFDKKIYRGPINVGPKNDGYGIALSPSLMKKLLLKDGDIVYFRMKK
jgi:hypothetical protein